MVFFLKNLLKKIIPIIDYLLSPVTLLSSIWLLFVRKLGLGRMRFSRRIFDYVGLLPIHDHYFQPLISPNKHKLKSLREDRIIKGLDLNIDFQLELLSTFNYSKELNEFPKYNNKDNKYFYHN